MFSSVNRVLLQALCLESSRSKDIRAEVFPYHPYFLELKYI